LEKENVGEKKITSGFKINLKRKTPNGKTEEKG